MSDINPLGASSYYSGLQNATSQAAKDAKKNEKTSSTKKISFSELKKSFSKTEAEREAEAAGYPAEIAKLSIEDAAVFLKDEVDKAGNKLSENQSAENIAEFKRTVKLFIKYVVENNYVEHKKELRGKKKNANAAFARDSPGVASPCARFAADNEKGSPRRPEISKYCAPTPMGSTGAIPQEVAPFELPRGTQHGLLNAAAVKP